MIEITCMQCNKPFTCKPSHAHRRRFCSKACMAEAYTKRQVFTCEYCGKQFDLSPSRKTYGRGKHCSPECQYAAMKARPSEARIPFACLNCGKSFTRYREAKKQGSGKYCSRICRDEHRIGVSHPQWVGGPGDDRGPNWQAQRRKALNRDSYTCQECNGPGEHVHHKTPFRFYGIIRYKEANRLSNLVTLCEQCHRKADAHIQRISRS